MNIPVSAPGFSARAGTDEPDPIISRINAYSQWEYTRTDVKEISLREQSDQVS
ncbi:hypothetical protein [Desulfospira joergensenii]|uniref:hypothetical protein n=1 Tax=Desulfospira joergensenii TaxID=53329 RepID=UPI0003B5A58D|nr:hypothetical protein [Desulfospira joergensenii]